jgi:hypothetical protein
MITKALTTLKKRLSPHLELSNSRLEMMCLLIMGMVNARTVNLSHLACEFPTDSKVESTYRRPYYTTLVIMGGISSHGETAAFGSDLSSLRS